MVRVMLFQHQTGARNAEEMMRLPGYHAPSDLGNWERKDGLTCTIKA